jgi:hypothetical protein
MTGILTPRLGLYKANPDDYASVDTDINDNYDLLDAAMPPLVCTSGTRPSTPYEGQLIYETDTQRLMLRTSTNKWRSVTPRNLGNAVTDLTDLVVPTATPSGATAIATYTMCRMNNVTSDGIAKLQATLTWAPYIASADPTGADGFYVGFFRITNGGTLYSACTLIKSFYMGKGGGLAAAPQGGGTAVFDFTPPVGTWDYAMLCWRTDGTKTFTFRAATTYPQRIKLEEFVGAEY